ncbi:MAG: single-stranded DNA-binding protein [Acidimicrobiales bacterium]
MSKTSNDTTARISPDPSEQDRKKGPEVVKVGNLVADPELRSGKDTGKPWARMRLAVQTPVTPGDWSGPKNAAYYEVTAFGSLAVNAMRSLTKGMRVIVGGRAEVRTWTDDDGAEHREKGILADALGPDLRWATVQVARSEPDKAGPPARSADPDSDGDGDEWAAF